jgi:predicted RNA binding protein YcfA (HicA-like mRNA interferase family)
MGTQKLPILSGSDVCKALCNNDDFQRQSQNGSHIKLKKYLDEGRVLTAIVPNHKELSKKVLKSIINQSGHTNESFLELV